MLMALSSSFLLFETFKSRKFSVYLVKLVGQINNSSLEKLTINYYFPNQ